MTEPRPLLTLTMILKDEAKTIERTLATVKPFIDRWLILDTGSTDGTQEVVRRFMAGVPGEVAEAPFVDFATSRNHALDLAGEASEFVMWLDADDELEGGAELRAFLEEQRERGTRRESTSPSSERIGALPVPEAFYARIDTGVSFDSARVFRSRARWRFVGAVHEVLVHPDRPPPSIRIPGVTIRHHAGAVSAERSRRRWERDVGLLERALAADPKHARSAFYLAKTLLWLGLLEESKAMFERRIALGGWYEEIYESKMALSEIASRQERPFREVQELLLEAHAVSPHRAEPLYRVARHYDALGKHALTYLFAKRGYDLPFPTRDRLFIDEEVYTWKLADLVGTSAYWIGLFEIGEEALQKALKARPDDERLRKNLGFYVKRRAAP